MVASRAAAVVLTHGFLLLLCGAGRIRASQAQPLAAGGYVYVADGDCASAGLHALPSAEEDLHVDPHINGRKRCAGDIRMERRVVAPDRVADRAIVEADVGRLTNRVLNGHAAEPRCSQTNGT